MAKPKFQQQQEQSYYEQDWSDENQDRCPGYRYHVYEIAGEPYETLIRCEMGHPHQEAIKMPGSLRVPIYPWLKDLATQRQANWAIKNRQKRSEKKQVGRLEGVRGLREILGQVKITDTNSEPVQPATPTKLAPLAQDLPPDVEDWLASVKGKAAEKKPFCPVEMGREIFKDAKPSTKEEQQQMKKALREHKKKAADDDDSEWNKEKDIPAV